MTDAADPTPAKTASFGTAFEPAPTPEPITESAPSIEPAFNPVAGPSDLAVDQAAAVQQSDVPVEPGLINTPASVQPDAPISAVAQAEPAPQSTPQEFPPVEGNAGPASVTIVPLERLDPATLPDGSGAFIQTDTPDGIPVAHITHSHPLTQQQRDALAGLQGPPKAQNVPAGAVAVEQTVEPATIDIGDGPSGAFPEAEIQ